MHNFCLFHSAFFHKQLVLKGWWTVKNLRPEVLAFTRACEHLLSTEVTLTEEERNLLEYYVKELSREFLSDGPTVRVRISEQAALKFPPETLS